MILDETVAIVESVRSLASLEAAIKRGKLAFIEVGQALREIQERRLYRNVGFATFEDYCRERWGFSRPAAYQYLAATQVSENLSTQVDKSNAPNFTQARELAVLPAEQQREVAAGMDFSTATVRDVKEAVALKREQEVSPQSEHEEPQEVTHVTETPTSAVNTMDMHNPSETPEWRTPPEIVGLVVDVLGKIDLDPCSPLEPTIPATHFFTKEHNGLRFDWCGRVYMNPPLEEGILAWIEKLLAEYKAQHTTEAIALVPARGVAGWLRLCRDQAVCFIDGRCLEAGGGDSAAPYPVAAVYLGQDMEKFARVFKPVGDVWVRWPG